MFSDTPEQPADLCSPRMSQNTAAAAGAAAKGYAYRAHFYGGISWPPETHEIYLLSRVNEKREKEQTVGINPPLRKPKKKKKQHQSPTRKSKQKILQKIYNSRFNIGWWEVKVSLDREKIPLHA